VPVLQETRNFIALVSAKPTGLADLGVPISEVTVIKKGRVHEFAQLLTDGKIGRRFQDLRVIGIKTVEAEIPSAKFFVQFEVFGDNTMAPASGTGFDAVLTDGSQPLTNLSSGNLFLPYGNCWYQNRCVFDVPVVDFDRASSLEFITKLEEVCSI
jgi:hypothetical protein